MRKEELLKFYLNYRLFIFPIIVALSSIILMALVIFPQTLKLLSNQSAKGELLKRSQFLEAKAQALESYNEGDLTLKVNYALFSYPSDKDFVNSVGILQNLTAQTGYSISSLSLGSSSGSTQVSQSYAIKLDLIGPLSLLPTLLNKIEASPRIMRVSSLETNLTKDLQAVTVSLSIDVLYSAPPTGFGSIDSPLPQFTKEDEQILAKLAGAGGASVQQNIQIPSQLPPRGKSNPFE